MIRFVTEASSDSPQQTSLAGESAVPGMRQEYTGKPLVDVSAQGGVDVRGGDQSLAANMSEVCCDESICSDGVFCVEARDLRCLAGQKPGQHPAGSSSAQLREQGQGQGRHQ